MTRKDYVLIAEAIREEREIWEMVDAKMGNEVLNSLSRSLARRLRQENVRFDRDKFLEAAGVK